MTLYLITFANASDRAKSGGKGYGLHRLHSWGLNVPAGIVLASSAYDEAMALPELSEALGVVGDAEPAELSLATASLREAILALKPWPELTDDIGLAWQQLSEDDPNLRVSCRSSATREDSATASFAGQFATVLGVPGPQEVIEAVKQCWVSVWSNEAVAYRASHDIGHDEVSMAVVIQRMVRADTSGVAFSVNPVFGNSDEVMINASWGLGETVVSGLVTPDTFLVRKSDSQITARDISQSKNLRHIVLDDGSIEEQVVGSLEAMTTSLTDEQVLEVAQLAIAAEQNAGSPQDIEWAYEAGSLYVLQTRPITTL